MDFLKNLNISDDHSSGPSATGTTHTLYDKINDALLNQDPTKSKSAHTDPSTPPPTAAPKQESFLDKIGDTLLHQVSAQSSTPSAPPPVAKSGPEGLFDKVGNVLLHGGSGKPEVATPEEDGSLLDKFGDAILGKKDKPPAKPQGLLGKLDSALGGGAAGEQKEGKLDKAIDLFQEHILKEGRQDNESALEQAKDRQIAATIRSQFEKVTGHGPKK